VNKNNNPISLFYSGRYRLVNNLLNSLTQNFFKIQNPVLTRVLHAMILRLGYEPIRSLKVVVLFEQDKLNNVVLTIILLLKEVQSIIATRKK